MNDLLQDIKHLITKGGTLTWLFFLTVYTCFHEFNLYLIVVFSVVAFVTSFYNKGFKLDSIELSILLFSILYSIIAYSNNAIPIGTYFVSYLISPISFYLFGSYVVGHLKYKNMIFAFLLFTFLLYTIDLYRAVILDITMNGFGNLMRVLSIYSGVDEAKATLYGVVASLGLAGVVIFIKPKEIYNYKWWMLMLCLALSLTTVLHLINRTGIVVALAILVTVIFIYSRANTIKLAIPILLIVAVMYIIVEYGIISSTIFDAYETRNAKNIGDAGDRSWRWIDALEKIWSYPLGWSTMQTTFNKYVHNAWLDIARVSGFFPFVVYSITNMIVLCKTWGLVKKYYRDFFVLYLIALNISFFLTFFVEPIIEGAPLYFYLYAMLWGIEIRMLKSGTLDLK